MAAPDFASAEPVINLHRSVVERLSREVWLAFESQDMEIGGLLLGAVDRQAGLVEIQDFDPLLCEDRPDHRFLLSDAERSALAKRLAARGSMGGGTPTVVGCYRSQIGRGLSLSEEDLSFARTCFRDPSGVFLLIQPSSNGNLNAGFFFWGRGQIDSGYTFQEFPFDTSRLAAALVAPSTVDAPSSKAAPEPVSEPLHTGGAPSPPRLAPPAPAPPPLKAAEPAGQPFVEEPAAEVIPVLYREAPPEQEQHHPLEALRSRVGKWAAQAGPLAVRVRTFFGHAWDIARRISISGWRERALQVHWLPLVAVLAVILSVAAYRAYRNRVRETASDSATLALQVERRANDLRVSWNRDMPAINRARNGVLVIRDGEAPPRELPLDLEQLHNGSVVYSPMSTSVQFRLELTETNNGKTAETVFALAPSPKLTQKTAAGSGAAVAPQSSDRKPPVNPAPKRGLPVETAQAHPPAKADARAPSTALLKKPALPPAPAIRKAAAPPSANGNKASSKPALGNAPAAPEQLASASAFVAARPIRETRPNLTASLRSTVTSAVEVQLRVQIDDSGRVVRADPLALSGPATESLVSATQDAARLWKFAPAKRGNQPIASEVVLKFSYRP